MMAISGEHVILVVTAMAGAIAALWRTHLANSKKVEKELETCRTGHEETNRKLFELNVELARLEGRQKGVADLAEQVLKVVAERGP